MKNPAQPDKNHHDHCHNQNRSYHPDGRKQPLHAGTCLIAPFLSPGGRLRLSDPDRLLLKPWLLPARRRVQHLDIPVRIRRLAPLYAAGQLPAVRAADHSGRGFVDLRLLFQKIVVGIHQRMAQIRDQLIRVLITPLRPFGRTF